MEQKLESFSLWCDFIERKFLDDGFLKLLQSGYVNGATSNPSIFKNAFLNSDAYIQDKVLLKDKKPKEIYETLALQDISLAATKLMKFYNEDNDGFISIEVDPFLDKDTNATISEGRSIFKKISKPNVMIKIPATNEGYEAMRVLMAEGINVNATLIFSPSQAKSCLDAFKNATEIFKKENPNATRLPQGVISIFVSRFDKKLDDILKQNNKETSKVGIMNASLIYHLIKEANLENVRALFASTGVKTKDLKADYYIQELLYPNSINTAPIDAIEDFLKSPAQSFKEVPTKESLENYFSEISHFIDMQKVYDELMQEGLNAFYEAFEDILKTIK